MQNGSFPLFVINGSGYDGDTRACMRIDQWGWTCFWRERRTSKYSFQLLLVVRLTERMNGAISLELKLIPPGKTVWGE
jgi:hypothetical protein